MHAGRRAMFGATARGWFSSRAQISTRVEFRHADQVKRDFFDFRLAHLIRTDYDRSRIFRKFRSYSPTLTSNLPKFSPRIMPMNARGAFSRPSTASSL